MRFIALLFAACLLMVTFGTAQAADTPAVAGKAAVHKPAAKPAARTARAVTSLKPTLVAPATDILHEHFAVTVSGNVTNPEGLPLPGATIWVTSKRDVLAVTNADGEFTLTLPTNAPIVLSCGYAGFEDQLIPLRQPRRQNLVSVNLVPVAAASRR
ncbi:hypothetical protein F0P96_04905 [Hymenobacter busanensis]|uniref:Uncharacterized protein n=1 Tax=Hymenobacter busanensis TaxID=2607656 RepID=A0A7L5A2P1_9BACT|nr:carboxypeptidase regulatory-like domain-containing protein [Hymenobacter busanensis]KAA9338189.1 hypothetical protein F0P96_04905 [Hymenobacter busanensis]QHJ09386.1 hypothetical protein GUY19_19705 [Hymenobacter busanensis]